MTEIRVVSAVANKEKVIFYLENGDIVTLKQTDPRLAKVMEIVLPLNTAGKVAIINLDDYSVFKEYESKSNGFVKFFKAAKSAVQGIFEPNMVKEDLPREMVLGPQKIPSAPTTFEAPAPTLSVGVPEQRTYQGSGPVIPPKPEVKQEPITKTVIAPLTKKEQARAAFDLWYIDYNITNFLVLTEIKRDTKISWQKLGFTKSEIELIRSIEI